jgi:hypothetical protein
MAKPKLGSGARFSALTQELAKNPKNRNPAAIAAVIGAKKYGRKRMQKMAAAGKKG